MTQLMFLDTGRCSDLLHSTGFFQDAEGRLGCSSSLGCGSSGKTVLNKNCEPRSVRCSRAQSSETFS
jgi:hypothetical protein